MYLLFKFKIYDQNLLNYVLHNVTIKHLIKKIRSRNSLKNQLFIITTTTIINNLLNLTD